MADTYGVTPELVAAELTNLYGGSGFSSATTPTDTTVIDWITAFDVVVTLLVQRVAAIVPAATDQAAPLAKRYIIAATKAEVMRAKYAGQAPERVAAAAQGFADQAAFLLEQIEELGTGTTGTAGVANRVYGNTDPDPRALLVRDEHLGPTSTRARVRGY